MKAVMKRALLPLLLLLAAASSASACEARGCTNVFGLPVEARLGLWQCPTSGRGMPSAGSELSSTLVIGREFHKAHVLSPDRQANVVYRADGLELHYAGRRTRLKLDLKAHNPREVRWAPDSRRFVFWAPRTKSAWKRVALLDVRHVDPKAPLPIVYQPTRQTMPFGLEWSPLGDAIFVIARRQIDKINFTCISRVDLKTRKVTEIVRRIGIIDFMKVSPLRGGAYEILFGSEDGLWVVDPRGRRESRLSKLPSTGAHTVAWHPTEREVALYFRFPVSAPDGRSFKGLYRLDLRSKTPDVQCLDPTGKVVALWYSPTGDHLAWSTRKRISIVGPKGKLRVIRAKGRAGAFAFSPDGKRFAYGDGLEVRIEDTAGGNGHRALRLNAEVGSFLGDLRWAHQRLLITLVTDAREEMIQRRNRPRLKLPLPPPKKRR